MRAARAAAGAGRGRRCERWAVWAALATILALVVAFASSDGPRFLMPGQLSSAHGAIETCSACHTKTGSGTTGWLHSLVAGDPLSDSKACLTCHQMPQTAFNAHGASIGVLGASRKRLAARTADIPVPHFARAQAAAFPIDGVTERGLFCATCHQEHQGAGSKLAALSNEQCQSCHTVKFDRFDGDHPEFERYPFRRRTRIVYDHAGHFGKHFPDIAKKDPSRSISATCATCHDSGKDRRVMSVAPFDRTCSSCHLDQILGKDRATGPKGIAFLAVPGLDLQTLRKRKAPIGEWPDASEAELTPFMKLLIARSDSGRSVLGIVETLNLQDLGSASDIEIKAVTGLAWEIKQLFHRLVMGKASDVLADLAPGTRTEPNARLLSDLTATLPRDVIVAAYRQWLPNLASEIAARSGPGNVGSLASAPTTTPSPPPTAAIDKPQAKPAEADRRNDQGAAKSQEPRRDASAKAAPVEGRPPPRSSDQTDDLLTLTEEEQRAVAASAKGRAAAPPAGGPAKPAAGGSGVPAPAGSNATASPSPAPAPPQPAAAKAAQTATAVKRMPDSDIEGDVDAETWAETGGWYRQDYAIAYRPTGHKDTFVTAWTTLTGAAAANGAASPAARVFEALTAKDAQGACAKCHSVDDLGHTGRRMNFAPAGIDTKPRRFTGFVHEPHLAQAGRGCLTCHGLEKGKPVLDGYKQGDPLRFVSEFAAVKKETCTTCHQSGAVRQDCLTCHKYHVNDIATRVPSTRLPSE